VALAILGAINDVINKTASAVLDSDILPKSADVVTAVVKASVDGAVSVVGQIRDLTKPAPAPPPPPGP
jgi:hypothetical protein